MSTNGREWMKFSKNHPSYIRGCEEFMNFAYSHPRPASYKDDILCPCIKCLNKTLLSRDEVHQHILKRGIMRSYVLWSEHGESRNEERENCRSEDVDALNIEQDDDDDDDIYGLLQDAFGVDNSDCRFNGENSEDLNGGNNNYEKFFDLLEVGKAELYPGVSKFSKLAFLVRLLHVKALNGWSNKSIDMLLELLKVALPGIDVPTNYYAAKTQLRDLGMDYQKIHVCPNNCMLYWKEKENKDNCDVCGKSRWKPSTCSLSTKAGPSSLNKKAANILRYLPLKPRLQRLFMSSKTSEDMRWHAEKRTKDGMLRHPADSEAWRTLNNKYPSFGNEPRNVRLGLASDGFSPFGTMTTSHSTWPVVLVPYNLPPWMCMKQPFFFMSLLIPGPSSPGNDIDVFLQPLIEELKDLWINGAPTYDASSKEYFQMHAAVLWTISDFPAYANLSGWSTKGFLACPCCNKDTASERLKFGNKCCYMANRRFLPLDHKFRKDAMSFDGCIEMREAPKSLSGDDVLEQLSGYDQIIFGKQDDNDKVGQKRKREVKLPHNWKKISIFFDLPYWKDLILRNNLDLMHIEKNNAESFLCTILNIPGKTKDSLNARKDLELMGIKPTLHPVLKGNKYMLPPAKYTLSSAERRKICQHLQDVKVPDNYSSNISRRIQVKQCKIHGLKSHDWHILIQQLLPVAARGLLHKDIMSILVGLSTFYRKLCSKTLKLEELHKIKSNIVETLCRMEMFFPPAFFDIMMHLPIHLAEEALVAGPVQYRWMYPIERYLFTLKKYVRNKSQPEGSIVEGYLAEECLAFCSRYLDDRVETKFNRLGRNNDGVFSEELLESLSIFKKSGRSIGKGSHRNLSYEECQQAHLYILSNCDEVYPYIERHKNIIKSRRRGMRVREVDRIHNKEFGKWFEQHIYQMKKDGEQVNEHLEKLSRGPLLTITCYRGYIVNGFRFHTKYCDRKSQNSGVFVSAETSSFASANDNNPLLGNVGYYGVLKEILVLHYHGENRIVLFKCDWYDVMKKTGIKQDDYGFTTVNSEKSLATEEPFIFASQAQQVFYVEDNLDANWRVVLKTQPRDLYDAGTEGGTDSSTIHDSYVFEDVIDITNTNAHVIGGGLNREDIEGIEVDEDACDTGEEDVGGFLHEFEDDDESGEDDLVDDEENVFVGDDLIEDDD